MTAQGDPKTPAEALQIVTRSLRETVVRSKVARGSPQRRPKGAHEACRGPQEAPKEVREAPKRLSQDGPPQKTEEDGEGFAGQGENEEEER